MDFHIIGLALLSYLSGGIPTGYLLVRGLKGIDIRQYGSGNPGAANVYRVAGPVPGAITLLIDALKGFLPVLTAQKLYPGQNGVLVLCGTAAIIGHDWTIFLGFKGGKGVATSGGVLAGMMPKPLLCAVAVFVAGFWTTGHISVGSMAGAAALPLFGLAFGEPASLVALSAGAGVLILYKHTPNIKRILEMKELHLREKKY